MSALANKIIDRILKDLTDRKGLRHQWDMIDEDVQDEIREKWRGIVDEVLFPRRPPS